MTERAGVSQRESEGGVYTVRYYPTEDSPPGAVAFEAGRTYPTLAAARRAAAEYLAAYPERRQTGEIYSVRRVSVVKPKA